MNIGDDTTTNHIAERWASLSLDKTTNPFFLVGEIKRLIQESIDEGFIEKKDDARVYIKRIIKPGETIRPEICVECFVDDILNRILAYAEFCISANEVTWRKGPNANKPKKQVTCFTCHEVGHFANKCYKNKTRDLKGRRAPRKHPRQIVDRKGYKEVY
ncbi:LAMI_0B05820g1_1 [Lachancea mirantina]|uniref:LAMI_0B05820g1_1 n=1 Tax=Lachancea mirantina TaxID=1230905 RepID=A0A1G4IWJ3_9SACH|nr:LAMI_0B05820g1_1 [Lachancea mirantina]